MGFESMKTLPNIIKPLTLFLVILQIFFMFIPHLRGFAWFVILTTILMLIVSIVVFAVFFMGTPSIVQAAMWPLAETIYAAVFCVCSAINTFYFVVNIFKHFNFFFILGTGSSVILCLVWGLDAFLWFKAWRSSNNSMPSYGNNQATAAPAAGAFPYPAGHQAGGANPA